MANLDQDALATPLARTTADQIAAADPAASAWVYANAGAGKTHVLVMRLLRLLLDGTPPERILCLTFTKAAAAEMSSRVLVRLAAWVTLDDDALVVELATFLGRRPAAEEQARARDLFAVAMEAPGGLKVQTIHAFCERLLQRFPLEAQVSPHFDILDEDTGRRLRRQATDAVLMRAVEDPTGPLGLAHRQMIAFAAEESFDTVLQHALRRSDLLDAIRNDDGPEILDAVLRRALGVGPVATRDSLEAKLGVVCTPTLLQQAQVILATGTKTDVKHAGVLREALAASTRAGRIEAMAAYFQTEKGELRSSLLTKKLADANAALHQTLLDQQTEFCRLSAERIGLVVIEATMALVRLADAIAQRYGELKRGRAALDFDDLIRHTAHLLGNAEATDWVLYKLDGGIDHILVDEAQDTSPEQWTLIESLAREFFAGASTRQPVAGPRTVFAVGDHKQSIYGFQGADPALFGTMGATLQSYAREAGQLWRGIGLTLSFRTVSAVLAAVDGVFSDPHRTPGVTVAAQTIGNVEHISNRPGVAGLVEIWDTEKSDDGPQADAWSHEVATPPSPAADRLAARLADTIARWLDTGEKLASEDRPIRAGDILVLVRQRRPFADAMVAALEARGVPVAGADRIRLADQLAVQDLVVLGQFLLLPEDDLALATVLKSPLFGLDDDDLLAIAPGRRGTLWSAVLRAADADPRFRPAAETLKRWRHRADLVPPFEFYIEVLDHDGMRFRLLTRLGSEAADAIDEFLTLAMTYDETAPPSLQGFIHWIGSAQSEIKRDMEQGRNEVRVMTVHGAKGLEAPIVFLPDTCTPAANTRPGALLTLAQAKRPAALSPPFVWPVSGSKTLAAVKAAREEASRRDAEEHHRLLYVAMTRARDRLYVAGFEGKRALTSGCWYRLIEEGLAGLLERSQDATGRPVRRMASLQTTEHEARRDAGHAVHLPEPLPDWATRRAPVEPARLVPVAPSRLAPLDADAEGDPIDRPRDRDRRAQLSAPSPVARADEYRFLRGTLTHALLHHLPNLDPATWPQAAQQFVEARGSQLTPGLRAGIVTEVMAVLVDPAFADLFGPTSRAEVPIVAEIAPPPGTTGPSLRITGQIDRLVQLADRVLIVDFKTNRPPPTMLAGVPEAYLLQLAAYRLAVGRIFAPLPVHAALLWTEASRIMAVPSDLLDSVVPRLFDGQEGDGA